MKRIECLTEPRNLGKIKDVVTNFKLGGVVIDTVKALRKVEEGKSAARFLEFEKIKVEIVVNDEEAENLVTMLVSNLQTGSIADGKVFVSSVNDTIRICDGERGEKAV